MCFSPGERNPTPACWAAQPNATGDFFLGPQRNRELRGAGGITLDAELVCATSAEGRAVGAHCWEEGMRASGDAFKKMPRHGERFKTHYPAFLGINKMWVNVSKGVSSISFAPCVLPHFGLLFIDL